MVFESLVVDLVNRFLGDFIENLDKSQLKIGIWGGDVVLNNLFVKESVFDELDLPVKVVHGNLGKLTLKIPWKGLYTEPVIASLDGLYVVAVPNLGVKYNTEKEQKAAQEAKQKELQRIEDAKKAASEKNKKQDAKADGFAEKLVTQVIKNLQVTVGAIHVRYEDHFTNPKKPFSIGFTLNGLSFQTTDENWMPKIIKEQVSIIYKMIKLDSLAAYWNCSTKSYLKLKRDDMIATMKRQIIAPGIKTDYQYLVEPICSEAQLRLHTKPEQDQFSMPKMLLNIIFEEIAVALSKKQYGDVMEVLESFERLTLASKYRKYRPDVTTKSGHSKEWWLFAYNCILEEQVRRRKKMWSWENMKKHRQLCKDYKAAYKKKLTSKKVNDQTQKTLDLCERELTVFNLTLARQQAEVEVKKEGLKKEKEGGGGWFGGWGWGGGKKAEKEEDKAIGDQFAEAMTAEEKSKLYAAIGYQENAVDPTFPTDFVANNLHFTLKKLSLALQDNDLKKPQVMQLRLEDVHAGLDQRPSANAIKLVAKMDRLQVVGSPTDTGTLPTLVSSQTQVQDQVYSLLDVLFETNPLDGSCDQRVNLKARPLEIAYDANTINQIAEFFKPPESVHLKQLQAAAMAKFEEVKEQTASGLQHAIDQHKYMEVSVDIMPTRVIIPDTGIYRKDANVIVLGLGSLKVRSERPENIKVAATATQANYDAFLLGMSTAMSAVADSKKLEMDQVMEKAYDHLKIDLTNVQLLFAKSDQDWEKAMTKPFSPLHILKPMALHVDFYKGILQDPKLPKMKVKGELPQVAVTMSDVRLQDVLALVQSIPFPESPPAPPEEEQEVPDISTTLAQEGSAGTLLRKIPVPGDSSSDEDTPQESQAIKKKKVPTATLR